MTDVAIVGMACRVPGAETPDEFWRMLCAGVDAAAVLPPREAVAAGASVQTLSADDYVRVAYQVRGGYRHVDEQLFSLTPREASLLDPQHRLFLEVAWEALESSGQSAETGPIGVYAGAGAHQYAERLAQRRGVLAADDKSLWLVNDPDFAATRFSYAFDLRGPAVTTMTACSSSLVAIHFAVQAIKSGECAMAVAGGAAIDLNVQAGYRFNPGGVSSIDGHCRPFDSDASGSARGNGAGAVVLKSLQQAIDDGDSISAVIKATAINNDGSVKAGFTAPSARGQRDVIDAALRKADRTRAAIGYVEAHGTGTRVGDPIELEGLAEAHALHARESSAGPLYLGSVKANIGHLDAAAGVIGLIKVAMIARHGLIPPQVNFERATESLLELDGRIEVPRQPVALPKHARSLAVSSFGFGGTNAHVVIDAPPASKPIPRPHGPLNGRSRVIAVSAASRWALRHQLSALAGRLRSTPDEFELISANLLRRRRSLTYRFATVATDARSAAEALSDAGGKLIDDPNQTRGLEGGGQQPDADEPATDRSGLATLGRQLGLPIRQADVQAWLANGRDEAEQRLLTLAAEHWMRGADVCWDALVPALPPVVELPRYPFDRAEHWLLPEQTDAALPPMTLVERVWIPQPALPIVGATTVWLRGGTVAERAQVASQLSAAGHRLSPQADVLLHLGGAETTIVELADDLTALLLASTGRGGTLLLVARSDAADAVSIERVALAAGALVAPTEHAQLNATLIEAPPGLGDLTTTSIDWSEVLSTVLQARRPRLRLSVESSGATVLWVDDYRPVETNPSTAPAAIDWLITGGLGSVGRELLGVLLRHRPQDRIVVLGRRHLTDAQLAVEGLASWQLPEPLPGRAFYVAVDVTQSAQVAELRAALIREHADPDVVLHLATDSGGQLLREWRADVSRSICAAKVDGARQLLQTFGNNAWTVLFSSLSTLKPLRGSTDYIAANLALESMALNESGAEEARVLSVGWPSWHTDGNGQGRVRDLDDVDAYAALHLLLTHWGRRGAAWLPTATDSLPGPASCGPATPGSTADSSGLDVQPGAETPDEVSAAASEDRLVSELVEAWSDALGAPVGADEDLFDAGLDSFAIVEVCERLRTRQSINLALDDVVRMRTAQKQATHISACTPG